MKTCMKRGRSPLPSSAEENNTSSRPIALDKYRYPSPSETNIDIWGNPFEDQQIPPPPKSQKTLRSVSETLFQSNCEAVLKEIEPDLVYTITKKEQPPFIIFTASVFVRGKSFEADNNYEAGAIARAAQLVLYYFMLIKDPALKGLNVSDDEPDPFAKFTGNPMYTFTLVKPGVKINIIRVVGVPPFQTFTARVEIGANKKFEGVGPDKRAAQNEAARNALSFILSTGNHHYPTSSSARPTIMDNCVSGLTRLKPGIEINIVKAEGPPHNMVFTARVVLNGRSYYGIGPRKQDAKNEAARNALSSINEKDQLENQSENLQEKIDELKRVRAGLKGRLQNLQAQSKPNEKTSENWKRTNEQKGGVEKQKKPSKLAGKDELGQYLKELDARNPTKADAKLVGNQSEKGETEPGELISQADGFTSTLKPAAKTGGFDWKILGAESPKKNFGADSNVLKEPAGSVAPDPAPGVSSTEDPHFTKFGDHIAWLIESTYKSMKSADPSIPNYKTLAGVVMTSGPKTNESRVISVATGSKSISGINLSLDGKSLNDCHAEILARRGLVSFLYDQLESYLNHLEESIFEPAGSVRLRIKNHILFHLYVSKAPCGSASEQGSSLRTKIEGSDGTVPSTEKKIQSNEGFLFGENLFTMSCTDKITRWNIVGVQGSLLTHIINPIYFHTVVIGNCFQLDKLRSSLIERVENIRGIPAPFVFVEPVLAGTTQSISMSTQGSWIPVSPIISVCWVNGWFQPEKVESINGKLLEDGSSSTLCKRTFFQRFTSLVSKMPEWFALVKNWKNSYGSLKKAARKFGETNELLMASLLHDGIGHWVKKPEGQDQFRIRFDHPYENASSYE